MALSVCLGELGINKINNMANLTVQELQYKIEDLSREINRMAERFKEDTGYYPIVNNIITTQSTACSTIITSRISVTVEIK